MLWFREPRTEVGPWLIDKIVTTGSINIVGAYNNFVRTRMTGPAYEPTMVIRTNRVALIGLWWDKRVCNRGTAVRYESGADEARVLRNYFTAQSSNNSAIAVELMGNNDPYLIYDNLFLGFKGESQVVVR